MSSVTKVEEERTGLELYSEDGDGNVWTAVYSFRVESRHQDEALSEGNHTNRLKVTAAPLALSLVSYYIDV